MRICPAGIVVKQLWERLCTKVQTICLFQSTCTPCSTDIKCCFSTLEELLVIVNTFCHITIIIQRFNKFCCFYCDIFIHSNFRSVFVYQWSSSHLEVSCPPYTIWIIAIVSQRNHRFSISDNCFTFVQNSKEIIFTVDIQLTVCV